MDEVDGVGEGDGVGLGFAASAVRSNPVNTSVVANNDVTGLVIGFIRENRNDPHRVPHRKSYAVVTSAVPDEPTAQKAFFMLSAARPESPLPVPLPTRCRSVGCATAK